MISFDEIKRERMETHRAVLMTSLAAFGVPESLRGGLVRWCVDHIETGQFLKAVLENDLLQAYRRADPINLVMIPTLLEWLLAEAPAPCWGDKEKVAAWIKEGAEKE